MKETNKKRSTAKKMITQALEATEILGTTVENYYARGYCPKAIATQIVEPQWYDEGKIGNIYSWHVKVTPVSPELKKSCYLPLTYFLDAETLRSIFRSACKNLVKVAE